MPQNALLLMPSFPNTRGIHRAERSEDEKSKSTPAGGTCACTRPPISSIRRFHVGETPLQAPPGLADKTMPLDLGAYLGTGQAVFRIAWAGHVFSKLVLLAVA